MHITVMIFKIFSGSKLNELFEITKVMVPYYLPIHFKAVNTKIKETFNI